MQYRKHWLVLATVVLGSFVVLGYYGKEFYREAPPLPERVVTPEGTVVMTASDIRNGQNVWQSMGGQQVGSIWGHGAYMAPDWSADWLHRECLFLLDRWARRDYGTSYEELDPDQKAIVHARLKDEIRTNRYAPESDELVISEDRAAAFEALATYYAAIFNDSVEFPEDIRFLADGQMNAEELRDAYAIARNTVSDPQRLREMASFFFWAAWSCGAERPLKEAERASVSPSVREKRITYTNNWPPEDLIGNHPSGSVIVWSALSVVLLLAGVGALSWYIATQHHTEEPDHTVPSKDPMLGIEPTPSMKATYKYFVVVALLFLAQVGLGAVTAHYTVEGSGFYGFPLAEYLPYSVTRTWHTQLAIFWIATAWLATGLFIAPAVSGYEPKFQRLGVNILFVCLLIIVAGSMFGTWYATRQKMGLEMNFWFGHQGYEYVDLGRFWQIFLFAGLFIWLGLMGRALWPSFHQPGEHKHLLALFLISSAAIALFYGAGLMWGRQTHLAVAEYWRWWVVHLWVEGFFEVFATVVIAFLFTRLKLLNIRTATAAVLFATAIFLSGGIIGTFHHLYFSGVPTVILALGAVFSALEVVPLTLIGFEAYENLKLSQAKAWVRVYRWPIYFFVAVAFWNLVGAGLFGFMINPPIALYYMQGLNTTPVHGHTALFGVYGMLGIGLMLFCLKGMTTARIWDSKILPWSFWSLNVGLVLMVVLSLLPVGIMQAWASMEHGLWYARSAEFLQQDHLQVLRWLRVVGDTVFAVGVLGIGWFVLRLKKGQAPELETGTEATYPTGGVTATDLST